MTTPDQPTPTASAIARAAAAHAVAFIENDTRMWIEKGEHAPFCDKVAAIILDHLAPLDAARVRAEEELAGERNLHGQTRVVVDELNTICNDLRNAGQPQFVRSEAIRLLREDQAALRARLLAVESERDEARATSAEWLAACRAISSEIGCPDDLEGWLIGADELISLFPADTRKQGYAQSPLEMITRIVDERDEARTALTAAESERDEAREMVRLEYAACEAVENAHRELKEACDLVGSQLEASAEDCLREHERANAAEARCAALEADKARLDWLESKSKFVVSTFGAHRSYHELPSVAIDYWTGNTGVTAGLGMTPATLRSAIDAAKRLSRPSPS